MKKVSIIIPALDEEENIGRVIHEIPKKDLEEKGYHVEILVVDNNSTDRTGVVSKESGAIVIVELIKGKGGAVRKALKSCDGDFVFMLDADFTYPATYIPQMLELLEGGYDVVTGSRLKGQRESGAMSCFNLMGNRLLTFMANILFGTVISDLCTGYWGFSRQTIEALELDAKAFELEANIFAEITKKGCKIADVPILYRRRSTSPKLNSVKDGLRIGLTLIKKRLTR